MQSFFLIFPVAQFRSGLNNFIDINGEGMHKIVQSVTESQVTDDDLDDFVCICTDGTAYASVNNGGGSDTDAPTSTSLGKWKNSESAQANVVLSPIIFTGGELTRKGGFPNP